jgi:hypothetical protein
MELHMNVGSPRGLDLGEVRQAEEAHYKHWMSPIEISQIEASR